MGCWRGWATGKATKQLAGAAGESQSQSQRQPRRPPKYSSHPPAAARGTRFDSRIDSDPSQTDRQEAGGVEKVGDCDYNHASLGMIDFRVQPRFVGAHWLIVFNRP
jgi:hypothetical protein